MDAGELRSSSSSSKQRSSYHKCRSCGANNASNNDTRLSIRMSDISLNGNSYENTPSPSSIASSISAIRSPKYRHRISSSTLKNNHASLLNQHRHRHYCRQQKMIYSQMFNRHYLGSMATMFGRMRKQIKKLKWRTHRVEHLLITRTSCGNPVIRIPRLTHDQISSICIENPHPIHEENTSTTTTTNHPIADLTTIEVNNGKEKLQLINYPESPIKKSRYCPVCLITYRKKSGYMNHMKEFHQGIIPVLNNVVRSAEHIIMADSSAQPEHSNLSSAIVTTNPENVSSEIIQQCSTTMNDQSSTNENEMDSFLVPINEWDGGEGRLRSRPVARKPTSKAQCGFCLKFYRLETIQKHQKRYHGLSSKKTTPSQSTEPPPVENIPTPPVEHVEECPMVSDHETVNDNNNNNEPSTIPIDVDVDDIPIRFRKDFKKPIVLAVTCLDNYQLELVEQFLKAFPKRVSQSAAIDSTITHLIANDRVRPLRAPLSMKLIEAIAHHCYCVSYRWIIECLRQEKILDELPFEIEGDDTETNPHNGPRSSRLTSIRHSLFRDICFMIKCTENSDAKMTNGRLQELITTCGGQIIQCVTHRLLEKYQIIVLCDMNYLSTRRHNYEQCRSLGINFVSSDWVLESILEYHRKPFALYEEMPL